MGIIVIILTGRTITVFDFCLWTGGILYDVVCILNSNAIKTSEFGWMDSREGRII